MVPVLSFKGTRPAMGADDTFSDEDSECPRCHSKVQEWHTKQFQSFLENWKKGEFLQYRKIAAKVGNAPVFSFSFRLRYCLYLAVLKKGRFLQYRKIETV